MRRFVFCLAVFAAIAVLPAFADINNGTFAGYSGAFETVNAGSSTIPFWSVTSGSVDWIGTYWQAPNGTSNSIDLDGNSPGIMGQFDSFLSGQQYLLTFWLAGNPDGLPTVKTVNVSAGISSQVFTFDTTGHDKTNMGWTEESLLFVGQGPSTTIAFASGDAGSPYGPAIGDVSASAVPEPAAILLMGTLLLGLAGALKRRA
jgi:choice-of-anchor C domain-containing protein